MSRFGVGFPYGTFFANVVGSFLLGFFLALAAERVEIPPSLRLFVATGFCGSLTTFSTFSYETVILAEDGNLDKALLNVFGNLTAGLLSVVLGAALARVLW